MDRSLSRAEKKTHLEREQIFPAVFPKILGKNLSIKRLNGDLTNGGSASGILIS